jgi:primosomal protein N' (replication factor Y) (superfamily II helicase)
MPSYADVAIPVAVDKVFTYVVPPELTATAGCRVLVPFGRRIVTGLIVDTPAAATLSSLKSVVDILDPSPVVTPELLQLCHWAADYYHAPVGEVVKAALPHAFSGRSKTHVTLRGDADQKVLSSLPRKQQQVVKLLQDSGPLSATELGKRLRIREIFAMMGSLEKKGVVRLEELLPRSTTRRRTSLVLQAPDPGRVEEELGKLPPRQKGMRKALEGLLSVARSGSTEILMGTFLQQSGASSPALRKLAAMGVCTLTRREISSQEEFGTEERTMHITLNDRQATVRDTIVQALDDASTHTFLLHGVTGSGKTQVYIEAIRAALTRGKNAIVLVPEISLTPQIVRRFKSHFGESAMVVHSRMSAGERIHVWRLALREECRVVIGPRSAIFAPLPHLGLIIVDEEHEATYKQFDSSPRYHARDLAVVRAHLSRAVVVLGSATPSIESYQNAQQGKYTKLELPDRVDDVPLPTVRIVDMTEERKRVYAELKERTPFEERGKLKRFQLTPLSSVLREGITERLARREGIILLQNRRGFAPFLECELCGHTEECDDCSVTMTYHLPQKHLRCHYCGKVRVVPLFCPSCGGPTLNLQGFGTQRVEVELAQLFPAARVLRMDLDTTTRKGAHRRLLDKFGNREADILLGTQMVAKGLDFPHVTLVGVISADTQMLLPDFRASERTFQLLTQVAGRAGRGDLKGEVIIQTHHPDHYALRHVVRHDFVSFFVQELAARQEVGYPPFSRLILAEAKGKQENQVRIAAEKLGETLRRSLPPEAVLGPAPAVLSKIKGSYRWHVLLKSLKTQDPTGAIARHAMRKAFANTQRDYPPGVRWHVDVDPVGTL